MSNYNLICDECGKRFDGQRYRLGNAFCSDVCRVNFHRKEAEQVKAHAAVEIIGLETGLYHVIDTDGSRAHKRLRRLDAKALDKAVKAMGYVWSNKAKQYYKEDQPEPEPKADDLHEDQYNRGLFDPAPIEDEEIKFSFRFYEKHKTDKDIK